MSLISFIKEADETFFGQRDARGADPIYPGQVLRIAPTARAGT